QTVGYTELFKHLDGQWTLEFALDEVRKNSRRFAKRQLAWYRKEEDIQWVNYENSLQESLSLLLNHNIKPKNRKSWQTHLPICLSWGLRLPSSNFLTHHTPMNFSLWRN